jgi:hypothetical protein
MDTKAIQAALERYRQQFNALLAEHHRLSDVPLLRRYVNLSGIEIRLGNFEGQLPNITQRISEDGEHLTLRRDGRELRIDKVNTADGLFLIIGNKTYRVQAGMQVDLYALVHQGDPMAVLGKR